MWQARGAMRKLTHDDARSAVHRRGAAPSVAFVAAVLSLAMTSLVCAPAPAADATKPASPSSPAAFSHDVRASDIMSSDVSDSSGNAIGKAEDLLVDPATGRITAAIVDVKDFFGISTRKIVIPVEDLKIAGARRLITTLDKKQLLAQAPPGH